MIDEFQAAHQRGVDSFLEGDYATCVVNLEKLHRLAVLNHSLHLALIAYQRVGRLEDAIAFGTKLLRGMEDGSFGALLIQMALGKAAVEVTAEAARTPEEHQQAHCYAGYWLATNGMPEDAISHLQTAVAIGGDSIEHALALQELRRLGGSTAGTPPPNPPWLDELWALHRRAAQLQQSGDFLSAIPLRERTCALARTNIGPSPDLAILTSLLGELYRHSGQFEDAARRAEMAISIWEQIGGVAAPEASTPWNNLGLALTSLSRFDEAERALKRALDLDERAHGTDHPECATDRHNLGELYEAAGRVAEAAREYGWSASVFFHAGGFDQFLRSASRGAMMLYRAGAHVDAEGFLAALEQPLKSVIGEARAVPTEYLDDLGWVLSHTGSADLAEAAHRHALALHQSSSDSADDRARSLNCLGSCLGIAGRSHDAISAYEEGLQLSGEGGVHLSNLRNNLGGAYRDVGRLDEARATFERLLSNYQEQGVVGASLGKLLNNLGVVMEAQSDFEVAEATLKRALELRGDELGLGHPDAAETMSNLGNLYAKLGHHERASTLLEDAMDALAQSVGTRHPQYGSALNNLALIKWRAGRLQEAEPLFRAAAGLTADRVGQDHPQYATALTNLANLYGSLLDHPRAEIFHRHALRIKESTLGPAHHSSCNTKFSLASLLVEQRGVGEEVKRLLEELTGVEVRDPELRGGILGLLAAVQRADGQMERSVASLQAAHELKASHLGRGHPSCAVTLNNLAETYCDIGRPDLAERCFRNALSIANAHDLPERPAFGMNFATMLGGEGRWEEGLELALDAIRYEDGYLATAFAISSERQRLRVLNMAQARLSILLSLWWRGYGGQRVPTEIVDVVLRRKGLHAAVSGKQHRAILANERPDLRGVLEELVATRADLSRWELLSGAGDLIPSTSGIEVALAVPRGKDLAVARLREKVHSLEVRLSNELQGSQQDALTARTVDIAQALPDGSALVEFLRVASPRFERSATAHRPRYMAVVITKADHELVDLGPAEAVENAVAALRHHLIDPTSDVASLYSSSEALAELVWQPLARYLEDVRWTFVAPDGELCRVPIELLLDRGASPRALELSYLSVGRDLLHFGEPMKPSETEPLVLGDPDYGIAGPARQGTSLSEALGEFDPLPGTRDEAREVANLLNVDPLLGGDATKPRVLASASPQVLHIATHGFFLPSQPAGPPVDPNVGQLSSVAAPIEDPMLRSGLALAGANSVLSGCSPDVLTGDGLLTARDVLGMDLHRTEMVVLSACETGLGDVVVGEGVFGLRRAFATAGARTLVMSLWKVPDDETQLLMVEFYRRVLRGVPRAAALREARDELRLTHPHPFYWGAFVCQGNPGPLVLTQLEQ